MRGLGAVAYKKVNPVARILFLNIFVDQIINP